MSTPRMRLQRAVALCSVVVCLAPAVAAAAQEASLGLRPSTERVKQGGVVALRIGGLPSLERLRLRVGSREISVGPGSGDGSRVVRIGVDLEQPPGPLQLLLEGTTGAGRAVSATSRLVVVDAGYPVQRLSVPRSFTELDEAALERVAREKATLDRLWETAMATALWRTPFRLPLEQPARGTGFGVKRIINGEPRAPHTGVDFSAPAGTRVLAANGGVVALADEHFFAGRSLVLDHGEGLYTMYFHLEDSLVRAGQRVAQGEPIGRVGSTGRATGPHLHWGARMYGARIDPQELLRLVPE